MQRLLKAPRPWWCLAALALSAALLSACPVRTFAAASCSDGVQNGDEAHVDCGGSCPGCADGTTCVRPKDCESGVCGPSGTCSAATCSDKVVNGLESGVDCGGNCAPCPLGQSCFDNADCASGACFDAKCIDRCGPPLITCGPSCVDPRFDNAHCGGCGMACPPGLRCEGGTCGTSCAPGLMRCGPFCVVTSIDVLNCGGCGHMCITGQRCVAGNCVSACAMGQSSCSGQCVTLMTDHDHCGNCGVACGPAEVCVLGQCAPACAPPLMACDAGQACINPDVDPDNCGGCGQPCPPVLNAARICSLGFCGRSACVPGFGDCNGQPLDGCETPFASDNLNCGGCGTACGLGESCDGGVCQP